MNAGLGQRLSKWRTLKKVVVQCYTKKLHWNSTGTSIVGKRGRSIFSSFKFGSSNGYEFILYSKYFGWDEDAQIDTVEAKLCRMNEESNGALSSTFLLQIYLFKKKSTSKLWGLGVYPCCTAECQHRESTEDYLECTCIGCTYIWRAWEGWWLGE